ncbi:tol-pal system-associated acyl-CoA thioesterase [Aquabacterium sp.]|uniref:tol-pal system-associated acyl-CoA thioesterase n=1 Tax=Aquabacterium sp. TaxID=1872578 RepID=UPI002E378BF5|nr:tol-pal system-associated acyl-CoA thioesterase [Aquabacterium sp.]HEX5310495.1 tol-pal system-associated acyl-CoA thioesterase [Aquabacterium sp.]
MNASANAESGNSAPSFQLHVRVYWEDTDAGGIVFYANYLKFMERARTEWLRTLGYGQETSRQSGGGMFVVSETQVRYVRPARLDDWLTVTVQVAEAGRASMVFDQKVLRGDQVLTEGRIRIGWVQPGAEGFRPGRIPADMLAVLTGAAGIHHN